MKPQIAIVHVNTVPSSEFEEFRRAISVDGIDVQIVEVDPPGPMAGLEWLMPTFVMGFVASSYFGGFFQEMGKDHYIRVREQFKKLYSNVAGPDAPEVKLLATAGKVKSVQPYSLYFSLVGEAPNGISLKLLVKKPITQEEYDQTVDAFLEHVKNINEGTITEVSKKRLQTVKPIGRTILMVFDEESGEVLPINPRTGELIR